MKTKPKAVDPSRYVILHGKMEEVLAQYPDNHFHSIVCDPPYGLTEDPDIEKLLMAWLEGAEYKYGRAGFMGKEWDAGVPPPRLWQESFRTLRPGGHILAFAGTRTQDLMGLSLRLAGFEVRDCVYWHYGEGMAKGLNASKGIDKLKGKTGKVVGKRTDSGKRRVAILPSNKGHRSGKTSRASTEGGFGYKTEYEITMPESEEAKRWEGWNSNLKPATEPIILARKPISEKTIVANVLKWGTGVLNIDACRIGLVGGVRTTNRGASKNKATAMGGTGTTSDIGKGRWPANVVLTHTDECIPIGTKKIAARGATGSQGSDNPLHVTRFGVERDPNVKTRPWVDEQGNEVVEEWLCVDDCPVRMMDDQSGESRASRFFYLTKPDTVDRAFWCKRCGRADNKESEHIDHWVDVEFHPTQKPVDLMEWLIKMVTPQEGITCDPFCGSGTTLVAAKQLGIRAVGIDMTEEYTKISKFRTNIMMEGGKKFQNDPAKGDEQLIHGTESRKPKADRGDSFEGL